MHLLQYARQIFPRSPHERLPDLIFLPPGCLSDHEYFGARRASTGNRQMPRETTLAFPTLANASEKIVKPLIHFLRPLFLLNAGSARRESPNSVVIPSRKC